VPRGGRMGVVVVTPPAGDPVDVADLRAHLRVTHNQEDVYIGLLGTVATRWLEGATGRAFVTQVLKGTWEDFPRPDTDLQAVKGPMAIELPRAPVVGPLVHVKYLDDDEVLQTMDLATLVLDATTEPARVRLKLGLDWPTITLPRAGAVEVQFNAGGAVGTVDPLAKHAIRLLVGQMYEQREPEVTGTIVAQVKGLSNLIALLKVPFSP
jgi:uncharacterized phiE125 gp8 family phage protein